MHAQSHSKCILARASMKPSAPTSNRHKDNVTSGALRTPPTTARESHSATCAATTHSRKCAPTCPWTVMPSVSARRRPHSGCKSDRAVARLPRPIRLRPPRRRMLVEPVRAVSIRRSSLHCTSCRGSRPHLGADRTRSATWRRKAATCPRRRRGRWPARGRA